MKQRIIRVATCEQLLNLHYFARLAIATANLDMPRRKIPDWMATTIYLYDGLIVWPDGLPFLIPDTAIDDAFNDDGSFRWLSDFLKFAVRSPRQKPQRRILPRLRLIDLAFRIDKPDIARHFGR